jgi:hypothetical protein
MIKATFFFGAAVGVGVAWGAQLATKETMIRIDRKE